MRPGAGSLFGPSVFRTLLTHAVALVGFVLFNASAHASSSPFVPHADQVAETAVLGGAIAPAAFPEAQRQRGAFEVFHGTLDTRLLDGRYWVHLRWTPANSRLLLQFRHGSAARVALFYPALPEGCQPETPASTGMPRLSISGWHNLPLCPGTTEAYLRVEQSGGYPLVSFRVTTEEKSVALDYIEAACVYVAGGLGLIASLLAAFRLVNRKTDALAAGFIVEQLTRVPFWTNTLNPPRYTNIGTFKQLTVGVQLESWRMLLVLGLLVFMQVLLKRGKQRSNWHQALNALTAAGSVALLSSFFGVLPDYTIVAWGLLYICLPLSVIAALQGVPLLEPAPTHPFRNHRSLHLANWNLAAIVLLTWITTALSLSEVTPDVAILAAIPFYLVVAASVIIEAADESKRAFADALQQRMARENAEREARQQSKQHAETRDLLLMLTHELRTPLGVLRFSLDAARTMPAARARAEEAIRNMDSLVERCLQAAHLEADAVAETPDRWSPALEIQLLVQQCRAPERVQVDIAADSPTAVSRRRILSLIVSVLLDNALKYGAVTGTAQLRVQPEVMNGDLGLAIAVDNTPGPAGLPDPQRVFQKYYRSPGAHQYSGAGLGLYLSKQLMERLNGQITYERLPDTTRFKLWIPC